MVEAVGVEPTSEDLARAASTSLAEILVSRPEWNAFRRAFHPGQPVRFDPPERATPAGEPAFSTLAPAEQASAGQTR